MDESASWRVGSILEGKWTLLELLGVGGMGCVFRAQHKNGSKVAIKILHPHLVHNRRLVQRFEREARLANQVEHPGVVRVFDDGKTDDGCPFLVTELLAGPTLEARRTLLSGKLPMQDVLCIAGELLAILEAAHERGVLHRDIKPANLLQTPDGELKILDFGIGCERESAGDGVTSAEAVLGTVGFMAPEQAQGRWDLVDEQTDLWAAGATLLKLASGLDAHDGQTAQERFAFAATRPIAPLAPRAPDLPSSFVAVLEKAMAFSKHDRYGTAAQMRAALVATPALPAHSKRAAPTRVLRLRPLIAAFAAVLSLGTVITVGRIMLRPAALLPSVSSVPVSPQTAFGNDATGVMAPPSVETVPLLSTERPAVAPKRETSAGPRIMPSASVPVPSVQQLPGPAQSSNPLDRRR
jgi:eukaryotic-like serine/threonine-protein kinase